ncbi:MAG TPA: hydrogenase/urease maturation nickel metallochaperone HypA [Candidatus Nanoarchaeia archaeon]|nr:hydrogenase/urease maturation nickel metallochaperone HypA [Candidatus Nanoarchaeia archaeon]
MHETMIAHSIIEEAKKHGKVREIYLELGELGHVPPEELLACLNSIVKWKIHPTIIKTHAKCDCGFIGHPTILERGHDSFLIECPSCKSVPQILKGTDITIKKVVVA